METECSSSNVTDCPTWIVTTSCGPAPPEGGRDQNQYQRMLTMKPEMVIAFTTGVPIAPETRHTIKLALAEYLPVQLFTLTEGPFVLRDPIELQMWEHDHSPDRESSPVP